MWDAASDNEVAAFAHSVRSGEHHGAGRRAGNLSTLNVGTQPSGR